MEDTRAVIYKVLFLLTFLLSSADTHTLQYFNTAVTPGTNFPEFIAVCQVDGEQCVYYDNIRKAVMLEDWIQKFDAKYPDYLKRESQRQQREQERLRAILDYLNQYYGYTEGVHTVQMMYGCERDDNGTTRTYLQYGYDGEDLISLDLKTGNWTAADEVESYIVRWIPTIHEAKYWMDFLENECIEWLKKFLLYGSEALKRKVNITWQKDGEDVDLRETLPNQDGSFQKRSILTVPAEDLQKHTYTCVIQHSSLEKEIVLEVPKDGGSDGGSSGVQIVVPVVVVMILIAAVAGTVVWKKFCERFTATVEELEMVRVGLHTHTMRTSFSDGSEWGSCLPRWLRDL